MVIDGQPPPETLDSLCSLSGQIGSAWTLCIAVRQRWQSDVVTMVASSAMNGACHLEALPETTGFAELLGAGLRSAAGRDTVLMYPGDIWAPDTVAQLAAALPRGGVAYADEDYVNAEGHHIDPRLKPDFSPEYLLRTDYVGRPLALSGSVLARMPTAAAAILQSRDHDLALRACEVATSVRHVSEVLCHRRVAPTPLQTDAPGATHHVAAALGRRGDRASVGPGVTKNTVRVNRSSATTATIIIPFRDEPQFLRTCVDSIDRTIGRVRPEFLLVDNGSVQAETMTLLDRLEKRSDVRVLRDERPFNWAALNNGAAAAAAGDVLVFLNNDIEARADSWLDSLCGLVECPSVGAAGARLLYPDHRLQHGGVVLGLGGAAGHLFVGLPEADPGYLDMAVTTRECAAVTGACLATRRTTFESHGGFDESLGIDLNDVDYCLRVQQSGLRVIYEPAAELIHYESPSRGTAGAVGDIVRFIERWKPSIVGGDRFLNPHLTRVDSSCALRDEGEEAWWHRWYVGLSNA
jgi:GT2 family glycosyltransferase